MKTKTKTKKRVGRPITTNYKAVVKLRKQGYTIAEVCKKMQISAATVHTAQQRA